MGEVYGTYLQIKYALIEKTFQKSEKTFKLSNYGSIPRTKIMIGRSLLPVQI